MTTKRGVKTIPEHVISAKDVSERPIRNSKLAKEESVRNVIGESGEIRSNEGGTDLISNGVDKNTTEIEFKLFREVNVFHLKALRKRGRKEFRRIKELLLEKGAKGLSRENKGLIRVWGKRKNNDILQNGFFRIR
jgi:hypothetical protein